MKKLCCGIETEFVSRFTCKCGRIYIADGDEIIIDLSMRGDSMPSVHRVHPSSKTLKMAPHIIGISGYKGSGKDTVAKFITGRFPWFLSGWYRVSLADPVRSTASVVYGFKIKDMIHPVRKEEVDEIWGIKRRTALINIGQGMRKAVSDDIWIKAARVRMKDIAYRHKIIGHVITWGAFASTLSAILCILAGGKPITCGLITALSLLMIVWAYLRPRNARFVVPDVRFMTEYSWIYSVGGELWCVYKPGVVWDNTEIESLPNDPGLFTRTIQNSGTKRKLKKVTRIMYNWMDDGLRDLAHRT